MHILIVDDTPTNLKLMEALIRKLGDELSVTTFTEPVEAMTWSAANEIDLLIVDYMMPDLDGIEYIRLFRGPARTRGDPRADGHRRPRTRHALQRTGCRRYRFPQQTHRQPRIPLAGTQHADPAAQPQNSSPTGRSGWSGKSPNGPRKSSPANWK
jgi:CheY-like chemotaxis protein